MKEKPSRTIDPTELPKNNEQFLGQLRRLNKQRAQFLHQKTQMDPDGIEEYLNREPEATEELSNNFFIESALKALVDTDATMGAYRIAERMEENLTPRYGLFVKQFQLLFVESLYNSEWDNNLIENHRNNEFRASIARLKALVLFIGNNPSTIERIKTRFCLELAKIGYAEDQEIPERLIAMLPDREKKELEEATAVQDYCYMKHKTTQSLQMLITAKAIDQSVLLLSSDAKNKVIATLRNDFADELEEIETRGNRSEIERRDLIELLEKYPDPGRIIEALLLP